MTIDSTGAVAKIDAIDKFVNSKSGELEERLRHLEQKRDTGPHFGAPGRSSPADEILKSNEVQAFLERKTKGAGVAIAASALLPTDVKNTIVSADATNPPAYMPGVVSGPVPRTWLRQLLTTLPIQSSSLVYTRENVFTNAAAAQTAEGNDKAESAITFTEVTEPVATYAHWLKVSRQVLSDNAAMAFFIENRLRQGLEVKLEDGIINGDGATGALSGLLKTGNFTAYTAVSGDSQLDSLRKAKQALEAADYNCDLILLNPADTSAIELLKATDDQYIVGQPIDGGLRSLWGARVHTTTAVASGNFVAMDSTAAALHLNGDVQVLFSDSDDDNFTKNLVTVLCEVRLACSVYLPAGVRSGALLFS
jgi:HK97 family phage major capsid protein